MDKVEIESQLHEQYAVNNNETATALITLLVALGASLGAYGYVLIHSCGCFCMDVLFTGNAAALTASAVIGTLFVMAWLCYALGTNRRLDQFIVYAIRRNAYGDTFNVHKQEDPKIGNGESGDIFPKGYHPFGKKNEFCIGIFGDLLKIINCIFVTVVALTLCRLANGGVTDVWAKLRLPKTWSEYLFLGTTVAYFVSVIVGQLVIITKENWGWKMILTVLKKIFSFTLSVVFLGWSFSKKYHKREEEFKKFRPEHI